MEEHYIINPQYPRQIYSSLDNTEEKIMNEIDIFDKTIIIVSHRMKHT